MGFGLGSVVKHMLKYPKVVGSNPSRSCFFVLFLPFLHEQSRFLNEMHVYLWCEKAIIKLHSSVCCLGRNRLNELRFKS